MRVTKKFIAEKQGSPETAAIQQREALACAAGALVVWSLTRMNSVCCVLR